MLRIASLNTNGYQNAKRRGLWQWFDTEKIDVLCLQECGTQIQKQKHLSLSSNPPFRRMGGLHTYTRLPHRSLPSPFQDPLLASRILGIEIFDIAIWNIHAPPYSASGYTGLRDGFYEALHALMQKWLRRPCIVCGDFNAVYSPLDLNESISCETQNRRIQEGVLQKILSQGWVDAFRFLHPQTRQYSFFSQMRPNDTLNNRGVRLDYQFVSPALQSQLHSCDITPSHLGLSDHCAVVATYQT